ncbi:unnamed protein product [Leptosia nina]|uniref:Lethal giant larvae homologue 2 domain-containing protein n=1 Tax=Leptosia nina TaxID=320188 RepID=A0AAV1IZZ4_9NEOP
MCGEIVILIIINTALYIFICPQTFRHGFPFSPTALAWDPIQKLLAIGDKSGNLRILGGPGVDAHVRHEAGEVVLHVKFLVNEGGLVTATADDQLHLWTFRQKSPQRVQSLKFQRERITSLHLPLSSKWLHVGTERGNVHVVNIETFALSGYVINWNKAIEVTRPNHPGAVVELIDNPLDAIANSLRERFGSSVGFENSRRGMEGLFRYGGGPGEAIRAAAWQHDGKLMTAHADGALATWTTRSPRPSSLSYPHAKANKEGKLETCKPIHRLEWKTSRTGESLVIFSGGLPTDKAGRTHSITVLNGKSTTVLEMEHSVVDFVTLCESPHAADYQEPYAIVVLLQNDLVVIDLQSPGYPCFENPYPMDIHESPVTCCSYFADCPSDLIPAFYSVGRQGNKKAAGFSEKLWPIDGGEWAPASCSYSEIILTGHADGSVKFWDASAGTLQILYKLKCAKVFERRTNSGSGSGVSVLCGEEDSPLSIQHMALCAESRRLCVALPHGHVLLFKFRKQELMAQTHVLEIPVISDAVEEETSPDADGARSASCGRTDEGDTRRQTGSWCGTGSVRVRGSSGTGGVRRAPGFQPTLVALQQGPPHPLSVLTINSSYGLIAWGGERGIVVVDMWRRVVVAALPAHALYLPEPTLRHEKHDRHDRRSPDLDQLEESPASPEPAEEALPDPKLDMRRKSTPWKTFNLKRQLSKVDLKLKAAFAPVDNDELSEKSNSQFYCEPVEKLENDVKNPSDHTNDSPDGDELIEKLSEDDKNQLSSPLRVCSDVFERMHKELQEKRSSDVYDRMHKELQERWQDKDRQESSPDVSPSKLGDDEKAVRPDNLPLFDDEGKPTRPPRQKSKKKEDLRDQRLLSVPNIKYSKQESVKDLRKKQPAQQGQSFAGNLMRRFRDFVARLCTRNEQNVEEETNEEVIQVPNRIGMHSDHRVTTTNGRRTSRLTNLYRTFITEGTRTLTLMSRRVIEG